jgi:hypothetical protein
MGIGIREYGHLAVTLWPFGAGPRHLKKIIVWNLSIVI